jgi:hypothetical protein
MKAGALKGLIAEAAITAKGTHRKLAFPLLPDQFRPLLLLRAYPQEGGWSGWLGRYQTALAEAASDDAGGTPAS